MAVTFLIIFLVWFESPGCTSSIKWRWEYSLFFVTYKNKCSLRLSGVLLFARISTTKSYFWRCLSLFSCDLPTAKAKSLGFWDQQTAPRQWFLMLASLCICNPTSCGTWGFSLLSWQLNCTFKMMIFIFYLGNESMS